MEQIANDIVSLNLWGKKKKSALLIEITKLQTKEEKIVRKVGEQESCFQRRLVEWDYWSYIKHKYVNKEFPSCQNQYIYIYRYICKKKKKRMYDYRTFKK